MTAKEMLEKCSEELKKHDWKFSTKELKGGDWGMDSSIQSGSGFVSGYKVWLLFRKWDARAVYHLDLRVPEARRRDVAEYLMRVNWRKLYGKFTLDFSDGEVCFEFVIPAAQIEYRVAEAMDDVFSMMVEVFDATLPGVFSVMTGAKTPAEAFDEMVKREEGPSADAPAPEAPAPEAPDLPIFDEEVDPPPPLDEDEAPEVPAEPKSGKGKAKGALKSGYSLKGVNIQGKIPLKKVVGAVKKFMTRKRAGKETPRLKILLSGVPGTGKTEFAKYLASEVGVPIRCIKVSDVVSKGVGDTEKAIARVFAKARRNGEMLFLDECDSFLQSRADADRSWEITQVNELLQQMEEFDGVMVAATNFADTLDKAVLRRFTYKLKLDYLTDEGKRIMYRKYFKSRLTKEESARLSAIAKLTPGDFRTVRDELFYLSNGQTNAERLAALEAESEAKGRERAAIGFAA